MDQLGRFWVTSGLMDLVNFNIISIFRAIVMKLCLTIFKDDVGRQFDKDGNKLQWWSNETITQYLNRTECFKNQYSDFYVPEVSDHVNGEITLGENIADNGMVFLVTTIRS